MIKFGACLISTGSEIVPLSRLIRYNSIAYSIAWDSWLDSPYRAKNMLKFFPLLSNYAIISFLTYFFKIMLAYWLGSGFT
jgi:hypothetical protein